MTHAPEPPKLALNQQDAAEALGVSPDFFRQHLRHEIRCVRRGRRRLYPISELQRWLDGDASRAVSNSTTVRAFLARTRSRLASAASSASSRSGRSRSSLALSSGSGHPCLTEFLTGAP